MKCDNCGMREAEYESLSGTKFCKPCAGEFGLVCGKRNKLDKNGKSKLHSH